MHIRKAMGKGGASRKELLITASDFANQLYVSACHPFGFLCEFFKINPLFQRFILRMYLEYLQTGLFIGDGNFYEIVKSACTQQGWVYLIHAIRGCKHQDSLQLFNAVHFCKKLTDDTLRYMPIASFSASLGNHIQVLTKD